MGFTQIVYPRGWDSRHSYGRVSAGPATYVVPPEQARAAGITVVTRLAPQDARAVLQQLGLKPYDTADPQ